MTSEFTRALSDLINTHGVDTRLNMPDFLVADFLVKDLHNLEAVHGEMRAWETATP